MVVVTKLSYEFSCNTRRNMSYYNPIVSLMTSFCDLALLLHRHSSRSRVMRGITDGRCRVGYRCPWTLSSTVGGAARFTVRT